MVGLGRMGAGIVRRLMADGHRCVGYDVSAEAVKAVEADGMTGFTSLEEFAAKLERPRIAWVMVPAGSITDQTIKAVAEVFEAGCDRSSPLGSRVWPSLASSPDSNFLPSPT